MSGQTAVTVYSSGNYKFGVKTTPLAKDQSPEARLQRFKQKCVHHVVIFFQQRLCGIHSYVAAYLPGCMWLDAAKARGGPSAAAALMQASPGCCSVWHPRHVLLMWTFGTCTSSCCLFEPHGGRRAPPPIVHPLPHKSWLYRGLQHSSKDAAATSTGSDRDSFGSLCCRSHIDNLVAATGISVRSGRSGWRCSIGALHPNSPSGWPGGHPGGASPYPLRG